MAPPAMRQVRVRDRRATAQVGRHARLELVFAVRDGRTVLTHSYAEPPFRPGRWFAEGSGLHMILASSSPGVFGGDVLDQSVVVEEGASVRLTSQSAPQLHPSASGATARVRSSYRVAAGARLSCHWDASIPFAGACLDQRIEVDVAGGAELYWSDAMMGGRDARGERWRFSSIAHELRICRAGALAYLERFRIAPADRSLSHPWIAGEATFFGTALAAGAVQTLPGEAERVHTMLNAIEGVRGAADTLDESFLVVRLMGKSSVPFHEARARVREMLTHS